MLPFSSKDKLDRIVPENACIDFLDDILLILLHF